ncbi:integrase catalytic domain-containing protein [Trichonephila clavipes]|nr:integrase catalytic domain-containing protein [Trichonephila clavipes]
MVELARNNFSAPVNQKKKEVNKTDKFLSAATLVSIHDRNGTVVFKEWEELEIIEKIEEKGENSYFLPLRPIVKDDSITTKIRPVFDASARVTGQSSLNDLLYKGPKLIEQIPDILDRSRISDRKKGQLSLDELESAEIQLIRSVQAQSFTDEKLISNLSIFRDDNNIIRGRRTVRKIWNACVKCRRFKSKSPMTDPASLPSDRVKDAAVFEVVGVDLAGPLYVKHGDKNEVSRFAKIQRITWKFIPPSAAWWGGFWERLVRTVKELLRRILGKAIFTYEELLTILCECETVVNSRPLTYLSEDMQDLTPITPARFLFEIPTADTKDLDVRHANHFRKRLRFRAKSSNIQVGDIVLIGDDWKKRLQWSLARVIKLIPGKDGLVRTVKLKTQSCKECFFSSDEAHFWLNGCVNKQNCRIWSEANPQVYVETPLHPEKLTVWCALWADGIMGPYFFKNDEGHNVTVNGDRYRAMITNFFIPELNNHDVQAQHVTQLVPQSIY